MTVDYNLPSFLRQIEVLGFFNQMTIGNLAVGQLDRVMSELVVVLIGFNAHKGQSQQDGARMEKLETAKLVHLAGGPGHNCRNTRGDQDDSVRRAHWNIEPSMRPIPFHRADRSEERRVGKECR